MLEGKGELGMYLVGRLPRIHKALGLNPQYKGGNAVFKEDCGIIHQFRVCTVPAEDPCPHFRRVTTTCNSVSRGFHILFRPLHVSVITCAYAQRERDLYIT